MDWEIDILERMFTLVDAGVPAAPKNGTHLPVRAYLDAKRFDLERERIFRRLPLVIGPSAKVRDPGDYFTDDATGTPLLVVRDRDGVLRAFLNVCRHRGARVVEGPEGRGASNFTCRNHAWTYTTDGALRSIPHASGFAGMDRCTRGLQAVPVAEAHGLIFARTAPGPDIYVDEYLGPLFAHVDDDMFELSKRRVFNEFQKIANSNWKLLVETNLEVYHIPILHKKTAGSLFEPNIVLADKSRAAHTRWVVPFRNSPRPPRDQPQRWRLLNHGIMVFWIFPNTFLVFWGPFAHVLSIFPDGLGRCRARSFGLIRERDENEEGRRAFQKMLDGYWATIHEDIGVVESVQAGLESGANADFVFGEWESVLDQFHGALQLACGVEGEPGASK